MKKITASIILSLFVCLSMAFPASAAAVYKPEWQSKLNGAYNNIMTKHNLPASLPAGYDYVACTYNNAGVQENLLLLFSNTPVIDVGTEFYLYSYSFDYGISTDGYATLNPLIITEELYKYGSYHVVKADSTLLPTTSYNTQVHIQNYIWDISTARFAGDMAGLETSNRIVWINSEPVVLPDISALVALLVEADEITDIGYTEPTWSRFVSARAAGHSLVASSSYTETQVTSATSELQSSMSSLTLAVIVPPPKPPAALGYDLGTGEISGYLSPVIGIFSSYVVSIKPVLITLFSILFSIKLGPRVLNRILRALRM